jgi:3-oxoacyl-[acyl-carrier-protein] synthase-3
VSAVVEGLGTAVPRRIVTNAELALDLDTTDEWVRSRTGIAQRHVADQSIATSDLAVEAGAAALKSAGVATADAVLLATMTPDRTCPPTAPLVASQLGLPPGLALDVNAACSGFVYGLALASGLIAAGIAERVLLIGADVMSRVVDPTDRNTAVLFGDGAGAVVLRGGRGDEPGAVGPFDLGGDGELGDLLHIPAGGSRLPLDAATIADRSHFLRMDGKEVYRQAVAGMAASCRRVLATAGVDIADVDHLVAHQANARILSAVATRLGIPAERCVCNVDRYGNTTAASIPLAMADTDATAAPGDCTVLTAFGAGLTWGSVLLRWPDLGRP